MTIYLDIILFENICMNYIIIFATAYVMKNKINYIRILISSLIGATYSVLLYINILSVYSNVLMKFFLSVIMTFIAFNPTSIRIAIKQLVIFYLVSFAFGGSAFALIYFLKPESIYMKNAVLVGTYPIKVAILGAIIGFAILSISSKILKRRSSKKDEIFKIKIVLNEKEIEVEALLDTGNKLKDPITLMPVIIVEKDILYNCLPSCILNNIDKIIGGDETVIENEIIKKYISKFKFIPFNSLGKQNGIILGIKPEKILFYLDEEEKIVLNTIVGIYDYRFNSNKYNALLGLEILEKINY